MNYVVYWIHCVDHTDILTEGYVGVTNDEKNRWKRHQKRGSNPHLQNAIAKYGWDNLIKEVILEGESEYCLEIEERLRPEKEIGWNIAKGGGMPVPLEKGQKLPDYWRQRISEGKTGVKFSDTHKTNLGKTKTGLRGPLANNFKGYTKATNIETGEVVILNGSAEMEAMGLHNSAVYRCLNGNLDSHKGYIFERIQTYE